MQNDVFGTAISEYYLSKIVSVIKVISDDFDDDEISVPYLFRKYIEMPPIEQKALQLAYGRVLDVGCGAGSHSLHLQNTKDLKVTAIDTSLGAINTCKKQGITHALNDNFYNHKGTYDTLLFLMNGSGIIGKLANLNAFFSHLKTLLNTNGQALIDSSDLIYLFEDENGEHWIDASQGYYGEMQYQMSYKNQTSEPFDWLYIDYNTLQRAALLNGMNCELIVEGNHFDYLARLTFI